MITGNERRKKIKTRKERNSNTIHSIRFGYFVDLFIEIYY